MIFKLLHIICFLFLFTFSGAQEKSVNNDFQNLGGVYESGIIRKFIVSNYPNNKTQKIYLSLAYDKFEIYEINTFTRKVHKYESPISSENQVFALVDLNDKLFIGTSPNGHLMYLDKNKGRIYDLGKALDTENYIWDLVYYKNKIYGCTYPNAKLFSYDLVSNKFEDLGVIDRSEQYARSMVLDNKGNLFIGTGFKSSKIKKYNIYSRKITDILPEKNQRIGVYPDLSIGIDKSIYVKIGTEYGLISNDEYIEISNEKYLNNKGILLSSTKKITLDDTYVKINEIDFKKSTRDTKYNEIFNGNSYSSNGKLQLFRLGLGPDNNIYISTALPLYLMKLNEENMKFEKIDLLGNGEVYSLIANNNDFFLFTYSSLAEIIVYNPFKTINKNYTIEGNPYLQLSQNIDGDWRPFDVVKNNNKLYIASMHGYGKSGGSLVEYDPIKKSVDNTYEVYKNQSITALASIDSNRIIGGTFVQGGYGSDLVEDFAKLFIWDTKKNLKLYETQPLNGFKKIDALVSNNNKVIGISGNNFFVFDIQQNKIVLNKPHFLGNMIYNSFIKINDNTIYGITEDNIFSVNFEKNSFEKKYSFKEKISGGVAYKNGYLYMITKNNDIVRYKLNKVGN